jgi:hypothetical protein
MLMQIFSQLGRINENRSLVINRKIRGLKDETLYVVSRN